MNESSTEDCTCSKGKRKCLVHGGVAAYVVRVMTITLRGGTKAVKYHYFRDFYPALSLWASKSPLCSTSMLVRQGNRGYRTLTDKEKKEARERIELELAGI